MNIAALSIARSLSQDLAARPFAGRAGGRFEQACNLIDVDGRVITLVLPELGNGPFSIVVASHPALFDLLPYDQMVTVTASKLVIGPWQVDLANAQIWEAQLPHFRSPPILNSAIKSILAAYTDIPRPEAASHNSYDVLIQRTTYLDEVITDPDGIERDEKITQAVSQLAGLGSGLTPAGDDYLIGVMAALWLTRQQSLLPRMAGIAAPKTTTLSAAFLNAAAQGEYTEPWHILIRALYAGQTKAFSRAADRLAQWGASSGRDALAGFATTLLNWAKGEASANDFNPIGEGCHQTIWSVGRS